MSNDSSSDGSGAMNDSMANGIPTAGAAISGALIAAGLAVGGWFVGQGFAHGKMGERYVTVRGLIERHVKADIAVWDISYSATDDDVVKANNEVMRYTQLAVAFTRQHGFSASEIEPIPTRVTDTSRFGGNQNAKSGRYLVQGGIHVRSSDVEKVQRASQLTSELIQQGVVLNLESDTSAANPAYYFTKLDTIRPAMLAEATKSARAVAQQFANDSSSNLGPIRRANQGVFEILPRDATSPNSAFLEPRSIDKTVRLVSTIDYYLED
jgi:hypothetical protein